MSSLSLIKIEPELAIAKLQDIAVKGFKLKAALYKNHVAGKLNLDQAKDLYNQWYREAIKELEEIFPSEVELCLFRDAKIGAGILIEGEPERLTAIRRSIDNRVEQFLHHREEILRYYHSQINFTVDTLIYQSGNRNKAHVK